MLLLVERRDAIAIVMFDVKGMPGSQRRLDKGRVVVFVKATRSAVALFNCRDGKDLNNAKSSTVSRPELACLFVNDRKPRGSLAHWT